MKSHQRAAPTGEDKDSLPERARNQPPRPSDPLSPFPLNAPVIAKTIPDVAGAWWGRAHQTYVSPALRPSGGTPPPLLGRVSCASHGPSVLCQDVSPQIDSSHAFGKHAKGRVATLEWRPFVRRGMENVARYRCGDGSWLRTPSRKGMKERKL